MQEERKRPKGKINFFHFCDKDEGRGWAREEEEIKDKVYIDEGWKEEKGEQRDKIASNRNIMVW